MNTVLKDAVKVVKKGELIVFPTDTVYGIGCDPHSDAALKLLFATKHRHKNKSIPVLVDTIRAAENLAEIPKYCKNLLERYWPGALTIIVRKKEGRAFSKYITRDNTIALRMPDHEMLLKIISNTGGALAATSANISGKPPLLTYDEVYATFFQKASVIIHGHHAQGEVPSTIINCTGAEPTLVRQGSIFFDK